MSDMTEIVERKACWAYELMADAQSELMRPFHMMKPVLLVDGNQFCFLYGANLMEGIAGFGDTAELASRDFDSNWHKGTLGKAST